MKKNDNYYHYTECGLDDVYIYNLEPITDDGGDEVFHIPFVNILHKTIALDLVKSRRGLSGADMRFLRTELGYTQAELAQFVHKDTQTIGRWERGESAIEPMADLALRTLILEKLNRDHEAMGVEELSKLVTQSAINEIIKISYTKNKDMPFTPIFKRAA